MSPLALVILRLVFGVIMIGHGWQKVNGPLHALASHVASLGLPAWLGYVSAFTEFGGGSLLIAGLFTRCVAFAVLVDMIVVIARVHWKHGFMGNGGYEFSLALCAIAFALIFFGAGAISIDSIRGGGGAGWGRGRQK